MAAVVSASPNQPHIALPTEPFDAVGGTYEESLQKAKALTPIKERPGAWRPRTLMLGHWSKRTWDLAASMNEDGRVDCVAATTDMRDTLVVLNAAIPAIELIMASSYYHIDDIREMLLDYEPEIHVLIAPPDMMNTGGAPVVAKWCGDMVDARQFSPKSGPLEAAGYFRRLSATSQNGSLSSGDNGC